MAKKIRVFVDSNVWFSAFYKKSAPYKLIKKLLDQKYEVVISELVLEEVVKNIKNKLPQALPEVYDFFKHYRITIIKNPNHKDLLKYSGLAQKKDLPILTAAINYRCDFLITGNLKDFYLIKIRRKFIIKIITPRQLIKTL